MDGTPAAAAAARGGSAAAAAARPVCAPRRTGIKLCTRSAATAFAAHFLLARSTMRGVARDDGTQDWGNWDETPAQWGGSNGAPAAAPAPAPQQHFNYQARQPPAQQAYAYQQPTYPAADVPATSTTSLRVPAAAGADGAAAMQPPQPRHPPPQHARRVQQQLQPQPFQPQAYAAPAPAPPAPLQAAFSPFGAAPPAVQAPPQQPFADAFMGQAAGVASMATAAAAAASLGGADGGAAAGQIASGVAQQLLGKVDVAGATNTYVGQLRYYFEVNNAYVLRKLKLLLFPWRHTEWERQPRPEDGAFQPPKFDVNAPDLYVPLMAFTTYVLLVGFVMGAAGNFQPDVFGTTTSSGVVTVVLEVIAIKLAFYLLQGSRISILELLAFSGYKFLSVCLTLLAYQLPYQPWPGHAVLLYAGAAIGTFTAKSLRRSLVQDAGGFTPGFMTEGMGSPTKRDAWKKQNYGLVAVGLMQIPFVWYLSYVG